MSKHSRRSEHVTAGGRGRAEQAVTEKLPVADPGTAGDVTGEALAPQESVGKYWVVIVLWTVGFLSLIAFEMVAAIFRR